MKKQYIFAVSGVKNSGKTRLIAKLIPYFQSKGMTVSVIKHDGHDFEPDVPETDSYRLRKAGAEGVAVFSDSRMMIIKENRTPSSRKSLEEQVREAVKAFPGSDVIILEGFKHSSYPKIEVLRKGNSIEPVCGAKDLMGLVTAFSPEELPEKYRNIPIFDPDECGRLAESILKYLSEGRPQAEIAAEGEKSERERCALILAGGRSRRMGRDKAFFVLDGETMLERSVKFWKDSGVVSRILVAVGRPDHLEKLPEDAEPVFDILEDRGPLAGILSAFRQTDAELLYVSAVDMPSLKREAILPDPALKGADASVWRKDGRPEPLFGVYRRSIAGAAERQLLSGNGKISVLLDSVNTVYYDVPESLKGVFRNINTEADAEEYLKEITNHKQEELKNE